MNSIEERIEQISKKQNSNLYPAIPKNMLVECSNMCNLSCLFCANRKMTRPKGIISYDFLSRVLKEAFELGTREVGFYTTGEPLLNLKLEKFIEIARNIGYEYIYITTNGVLANIERVKGLVKAGLNSIKFSINAVNDKEYIFIHGKDKYNIVMNNLKDVWRWKENNNIDLRVYVSYISTKYTEYELDVIENNFINYFDKVLITNVRNQSGAIPDIIDIVKNRNEENKIQGKRNLPCYYPFNTLCITREGYLTGCCTDFQNYLAYADLNKISLKEAWYSETITNLRKQHISGNMENNLCYNCIFNSKIMPEPLVKELACKFDDNFFEDSYIIERIKEYEKQEISDKTKK